MLSISRYQSEQTLPPGVCVCEPEAVRHYHTRAKTNYTN